MKNNDMYIGTQEAIFTAANRVIMEKGAEGFTLEAVAKVAGISKGGLLYHFPSKTKLIQGMMERMIASVEATLREELIKSQGDYLTAYIRASFKTGVEPEPISNAFFAALANDPILMEPLRVHFKKMQSEIAAAAPSPEIGTLIRFALDGLWYSELYNCAPPSSELREKMMDTLLSFVQGKGKIQDIHQDSRSPEDWSSCGDQ